MKKLAVIIMLTCFASCKKAEKTTLYSFVQVKYIENEDYVLIETTEGDWNRNTKIARLTATGYNNERFNLLLPQLTDTGYYPAPAASNISYADGANFMSYKFNNGFIYISYIDSLSVMGKFQVSLASDFNGNQNRIIVGNFGINFP
jgi:hypothetical protein